VCVCVRRQRSAAGRRGVAFRARGCYCGWLWVPRNLCLPWRTATARTFSSWLLQTDRGACFACSPVHCDSHAVSLCKVSMKQMFFVGQGCFRGARRVLVFVS